jgi:hypothetical protein
MNYKSTLKTEKQRSENLLKQKTMQLKTLSELKQKIKILKHERNFLLDVLMANSK